MPFHSNHRYKMNDEKNHFHLQLVNTYHAVGVSKYPKMSPNITKYVTIVEIHYHIWNHHGKCIQISTNMPGIGAVSYEIGFQT